jgi:integrase
MRGSVYYQTSQLTKAIFQEGAKKYQKNDSDHTYYMCVSSFQTMETYRKVWNNLSNYLKEHWKLKDLEKINEEHIHAYISYKIEYYPSKQYLEKIVAAIGKLEWALKYFCRDTYDEDRVYDFSVRSDLLHYAKVQELVADGYHNRVYHEAERIIENLSSEHHKIAARIQLFGGARAEGVTLIKHDQLKGMQEDKITQKTVGIIETKEKGGKIGDVMIPNELLYWFDEYFKHNNTFRINYQAYADDIRQTCLALGITPQGTHGFRWTFAQNRVRTYQDAGYNYEQAIQGVSWEMKHFRADITEHYVG